MRILITNHKLGTRGGSEAFVRDLARGLQSLGHSVIAYSSDLRQRERLLENDMIPVATDLEKLPYLPDVIHGQHHLDAMSAVLALPGVPALYHTHEGSWLGCPPKHPRIYHYLAVSRTLRERLIVEFNIPQSDITVFLNGVDLARFCRVRTPPVQAARALFYNSRQKDSGDTLSAIREAALQCGLEFDCVGTPFGNVTAEPEKLLPCYDIVFASGISAIEAMACGCAVVILGRTSCGEMVQPENFDRFRQVNFSIAVNSPPPSVERIVEQLRGFNAGRCAAVTERLRREADFSQGVRQLVTIYEKVIERHNQSKPDLRAEVLAASRYLRMLVPLIKETRQTIGGGDSSPENSAGSFEKLGARVARIEQQLNAGANA